MERPETLVWDAYARALPSMLDAVGRTPLVRLTRVGPDGLSCSPKIEWYGPTGSTEGPDLPAHDRACRGARRPQAGMTIVESTTGNAGIAVPAVAAIKGYDCVIVMPRGMSIERKRMIEAYGAELVLTPARAPTSTWRSRRCARSSPADPERYFVPAGVREPRQSRRADDLGGGDLAAVRLARSMPSSQRRGPGAGSQGSLER
jgi:cysteine synthase